MRPGSILIPIAIAGAAAFSCPAAAREFCPDRPGLGTPPCTIDPGHVAVEIGILDWTLDRDPEMRTDTILAGDLLVRAGVADHAEVQIGWTSYGHVRTRDRTNGAIDRSSRTGDITLALRRNLMNPDGSGISIAIMPYATLPVGRMPLGAGDWGAGLIAPMSFDLGHSLSLGLSPEIDAVVNEDGNGRHLAFGSVAGLGLDLSKSLSATLEASMMRENAPGDHVTQSLAGLSFGWQPKDALQFDLGANLGLNHASPDVEVYAGIARRF